MMNFAPDSDTAARAAIERIDALSTHHDPVHEGVRVRWRRFGEDTSKPPLVLLHGGHGSWMHWLRNVEALSAARSVLVPDMPGFAESDTPPAPGKHCDSVKGSTSHGPGVLPKATGPTPAPSPR